MRMSFDEMVRLCAESLEEALLLHTDILWRAEQPVRERMLRGFQPASAVEIGMGNGYYLAKMAAAYPGCSFLGVDHNKAVVKKAEKWFKNNGPKNVSFLNASFAELAGEDRFDLALTRLALQYFPGQAPLYFKKMRQVLKPGGMLLIFEPADYYFRFPPEYPLVEKMFKALTGYIGAEGRNISEKFPEYMEAAGFSGIERLPCPADQRNCGEDYFLLLCMWGVFARNIGSGRFTGKDLAGLLAELERARTDKAFSCQSPMVCVKGRKTA